MACDDISKDREMSRQDMQGQLQVTASKVSLSLFFSVSVSVSLPPSLVTCKELNPANSHRSSEANRSSSKLSQETLVLADTFSATLRVSAWPHLEPRP